MACVRNLLLTLASGSALYSGMVPALGLGGITLHSALNQPLEADIELLQMGDLESGDIRVRLASEADFARSGVERLFFLNDLRFTPLLRGSRNVIRVVSTKPVREPYLNFVIEVARPSGQLLREYTVLLDPPSSSAYSAVAAAPVAAPPRQAARPVQIEAAQALPAATRGQRYQVQRGDSLWLIAQRLRATGSQLSQQALMQGLYGLNPEAFVGGNRDRLTLGATLLLPDAAAPVEQPVAVPSVASGDTVPASVSPAPAVLDEAQSVSSPAPAVDAQVAQRVEQELALRAAENRQLQASMLALQAQLQALQEQMQAKDQQLALLRADLASSTAVPALAPSVSAETAVPAVEESVVSPPASVQAVPAEAGRWRWLLGGAGLLLGALASLAWWRRGRRQAAPAVAAAVPTHQVERPVDTRAAPLPEVPVQAPAVPVAARPAAPAVADALAGANIYIAYGRFGEALVVLRQALELQPQRTDLRLRLLVVLGELGDGAGFTQEEAALREQGLELAQLDQLHARYASRLLMAPAAPVQASDALADAVLQLDEPSEPVASSPAAEDEYQLNLDDLSLDANWDLLSPFKTSAVTRTRAPALDVVANDPAFRSDLRHLPEVSELSAEQGAASAFADWPESMGRDAVLLDDEFTDAFSAEPVRKAVESPALGDLQHLAGNRANLVKLNKALAYIEQGDLPSACDILNEVISEGDDQQKSEARALLARIA